MSVEEHQRADDEAYERAVELIGRVVQGSFGTSFLQRHLMVGYNRASRVIERLEADGVIRRLPLTPYEFRVNK